MIIFVWGEDTISAKEKVDSLIGQFKEKKDLSGLNVVELEGGSIKDFESFRNIVSTVGFLSDKKLIVIKDFVRLGDKGVISSVFDFLKEHTDDDNHFIFWEKGGLVKLDKERKKFFDFLQQQKFVFSFQKLKGRDLRNWIIKKFKERNIQIQLSASEKLAFYFENDLHLLSQEIEKISNYVDRIVSEDDIEKIIYTKEKEDVFGLIDAVLNKNKQKAIEMARSQLSLYDASYVLNLLLKNLKVVLQAKILLESYGRVDESKIDAHPYMVKKSTLIAKKTSTDDIKKMIFDLYKIDEKIKTGHSLNALLLDLFILEN